MKKHKILLVILATVFVFVSGCQHQVTQNVQTQKQFDELLEDEFITAMQQDYISTHIYFEQPETYQIDTSNIEVSLGSGYHIEDRKEDRKHIHKFLDELSAIDYRELRDDQQSLYLTLIEQTMINKDLLDEKYDYYDQAFSSMSGIHYQLPTLFSDWVLRNEQDIQDLIVLIQDVKPYIEDALVYTKQQADKHLFMTDIEDVISYCETILEHKEHSAIVSSIYESIDALQLEQTMTSTYKQQIQEAFDSSFYPAYEQIISTMRQLSSKNNQEGLAKFPEGKAYYELLIQKDLGALTPLKEVKNTLNDAFREHFTSMYDQISNAAVQEVIETNTFPETSYTSYQAILEDIQTKMQQDFPAIQDIRYEIGDVNKQLASTSGVAAYFNVPALDATTPKQMRVNPNSSDIKSLSTYMTVAHEGFPGHMYQYAYMYENITSNFQKTLINVPAYVEGYAVYAQYESLSYIQGIDKDILSLYKNNEIVSYCVTLLADIGIHHEGWSFQEYKNYMSEMGYDISDEQQIQSQYQQLQANPAAFVPYYIGYLEFEKIRNEVEEQLKDNFDKKQFHEAILSTGIANFDVVEAHVKQTLLEK